MTTFNPNSINSIVAWIDAETGVNGTDNGAINSIINQANSISSTPPPPPPPPPSNSTFPTAPIANFPKASVFTVSFTSNGVATSPTSGQAFQYWIYVPSSYDSTHSTPTTMFVWLHGCGGQAQFDIDMVSPGTNGGNQNWISVAIGFEENNCWDTTNDRQPILDAIANVKTHFNINPKTVMLGGYSSGGDIGYRLIFENSNNFAGILAENTDPFRDTGATQAALLAAASWKFNIAHLAHLEDTTYPIATVQTSWQTLINAGWTLNSNLFEFTQHGTHYDNAGAVVNGITVAGTAADLQNILLPLLNNNWTEGKSAVVPSPPSPLPPPTPPPTTSGLISQLRTGTNLVGLESATYDQYSASSGPPTGNYPVFSSTLLNWLQSDGVGVARITVAWEALQSSLNGSVPASTSGNYGAYWNNLIATVKGLLSRGIAVIIEPWGYNSAIGDTDICYRGAAFTPAQFAGFWGPFAAAVNVATNNDQFVGFGLMNEPHLASDGPSGSVGTTLTNWFACAQAAITAIRNTGATNAILVPGMNYTDSNSFVSNGSAAAFLQLTDPANNLAVSVHNYNGLGSSSATILIDSISSLVSWAQTNKVKVHIGEMAIDAGSPTSSYSTAQTQWANWDNYLKTNSTNLLGFCWWATGSSGWWDNGDSSAGMHWGLAQSGTDNQPSVYMNLIKSSLTGNNGVAAELIHATTSINNFVATYPNRPVWRTSASGSSYGFDNGTKHSISFEGSPDFLTTQTSIALPNGVSYWAVVKYSSTHQSVNYTQDCPLTLCGDYNSTTSMSQFGFTSQYMKLRYKVNGTWTSYNSWHNGTLNDGKMHCIACTHDLLGNVHFYVNGILKDSYSGITYNPNIYLSIVGSGYNKNDPFIGQVAEMMVFNGALSASDITNLTNRAITLWVN